MKAYDRIVLGLGGVGSAALFHLADRGLSVLGVEQYCVAHDKGSSHGQTRIIRRAYFEHPDYVPLLTEAYRLWGELEQLSGRRLFERVGLVEVGPPDGTLIRGVRASVAAHDLAVDQLDQTQLRELAPGLQLSDGQVALYERDAGYLHVERCVQHHVQEATALGADVIVDARAKFDITPSGIRVTVDGNEYVAGGLVVCAGPWSAETLNLPVSMRVLKKYLHWFDINVPKRAEMPAFFYELDHGCFYGFPDVAEQGMKICEHTGGEAVQHASLIDRSLDPSERARVADAIPAMFNVERHAVRHNKHAACMYTMTTDEHFIVDCHPEHGQQLVFAAGLSGHGFKFVPVIGRALADLSASGNTSLPIEFLGLRRLLGG